LEERASLVVEEQVPDSFADGRFVISDADMMVLDSKFGGGNRRVSTWNLEGVAEQERHAFFVTVYFPVRGRFSKRGEV
jgi:hypothetical protein